MGFDNVCFVIFNVKEAKIMEVAMNEKKGTSYRKNNNGSPVKFEVYGDVLIEKIVRSNGKGGRIYLPPDWVGKTIKIIK
jgi:hypothetical protein